MDFEPGRDMFDLEASFCSVLSSPVRLRIMWMLGKGELGVSQMAAALSLSMPNVSQHLRIMKAQGVVGCRRRGRAILYHLTNPKFLDGVRLIRQGLMEELMSSSPMCVGCRRRGRGKGIKEKNR